jgi:hypothetical protein
MKNTIGPKTWRSYQRMLGKKAYKTKYVANSDTKVAKPRYKGRFRNTGSALYH